MTQVRERSPSPERSSDSLLKRLKTTHPSLTSTVDHDSESLFYTGLFRPENVQQLHQAYAGNEPFKYAIVEKLFQDDLLKNVKDECMNELSFTERETDIYKVNQTGDLASLSYLSEAQLALFPNLLFRKFLQAVTGCGTLSGTKQDMSVNSYTQGCHLLNHDDVIGTRRVSYILYMPLPYGQQWQKEWGGALELLRLHQCKAIPPSWNQFIFFEVQPGKSFHSVEEVVVGGDGRARLSISGWFHAAQEGEEGYQADQAAPELKSSREQLTSSSTSFVAYSDSSEPPHPDSPLRTEYISYLSKFLNPVYLQTRTMKALMARFVAESHIELHHFLSASLVLKLEPDLRGADQADGLDGGTRQGKVPPHSAGVSGAWSPRGPPHKWRYCTLQNTTEPPRESDAILRQLQDEVFPSEAFRAWLSALTKLLPLSYAVEARRFRPGLDYTLATSEGDESRLDVVLGLTPKAEVEENEIRSNGKSKANEDDKEPHGWQAGEWGGWECYMAPHDEEDDPAVYRSGSSKKSQANNASGSQDHDDATETGEQEDEEDESTLLTVQPGFNRLLLVLRDEGVMRFVKYVSAAAAGSRWDICGEFNVGMVQDGEDDEDS
ncbi:nuclear protein [Suillus paluster]|uniref:nuclear protein n=1 Tax=Suillus paluster TaxID=48578 RepID=UPI001B87D74C|nr:nuclear protein [Suillus paluster]KAG1752418.1 nuclear protein [Suillus paluster]